MSAAYCLRNLISLLTNEISAHNNYKRSKTRVSRFHEANRNLSLYCFELRDNLQY